MEETQIHHWMNEAYQEALKAKAQDEVPVGAVYVHNDKVIGRGFNSRIRTGKTTSHAEIEALEAYNLLEKEWRFYPGTSLFVTVEPCLMCTGALLWARVDHIYYGCGDPKEAGVRKILPMIEQGVFDHRFTTVKGGYLEAECTLLMKEYFSLIRRRKKEAKSSPPPTTTI